MKNLYKFEVTLLVRILVAILFMLLSLSPQAGIYLHSQTATQRNYTTIVKRGDLFVFREYSQNRGDYQEKVFEKKFENFADAYNYLKLSKKFKEIPVLDFWEVASFSNDKGLFGKKHSYIWEAKNQWDNNWENKYAKWIEDEVGVDFYIKRGLSTDCADALVGLRWIFARINSLPVANTLSDSGNLFGHFSMNKKWAKLKKSDNWNEDEVFLAALSYIMDLTSTRTVIRDGYPIKIDAESIKAGTYFITLNNNGGHAKIISKVNFNEPTELPIFTYASTSPRAIRNLALEIMVDQEWPTKGAKELLAFRWPILSGDNWNLLKPESHPNYSLEEFDTSLHTEYPAFISYILFKTKGNLDPQKLVESAALDIKRYVEQRIDVVNNGYDYCSKKGCPPNSEMYDEWSTPSRDAKLLKKYIDIDQMVSAFEYLSPGLSDYWFNQLRNESVNIEGIQISLASIRYLFENKFFSIDPNMSPKIRWGINGSQVLPLWYDKIIELLNLRSQKVLDNSKCNGSCHPKSNEWISYNSYTIDSDLNKLLNQVRAYCQVISIDQCAKDGNTYLVKKLRLGSVEKTFGEWLDSINLFHSDPRVSFERRWGILNSEVIVQLPYFETITISKNGLGLLDSKNVINLNTNKKIYSSSSRIVLSGDGVLYSIDKGKIRFATLENSGLSSFNDVVDTDNVLHENPDRLVSYSEIGGYGIFRKSLKDSTLAFRIKKGQLEFIDEYQGSSFQFNSLLMMVKNNNLASFADLEKTKIIEMSFPESSGFKNINKLKLIDYSYPYILADYDDQEWAIHFPVLINLETNSIVKINLNQIVNYQLKAGSAKLKKMFILENWNNEEPTLSAVKINLNGSTEIFRQGNTLLNSTVINDVFYFAEGVGNQWGTQIKNLKIWNDKISTIRSDLKELIFINNYAYLTKPQEGTVLLNLENKIQIGLPEEMTFDQELVRSSDKNIFSYRFETTYGEYYQMGGGFDINNLLDINKEEIIPNFAIYPSINKENLVDERWRNNFKDTLVRTGVLISTGKNTAFWWKAAK